MNRQTVLVVGGAGYIGSHMVMDLIRRDYEVVVLDNLCRGHRELMPGGTFVEGDLGDATLLDQIFSRHPITAVMHFAAFSLVGESVEKASFYYRNNVSRTIDCLMRWIDTVLGILFFLYCRCTEAGQVQFLKPPCQPTNPGGATKVAVERFLADCAQSIGLKYISLRYFNAAGADASGMLGERHEPETHLIPLVLHVAAGERKNIRIFGTDYPTADGTCIRDYVHVSDLTQAHILALESLLKGGDSAVYNLGNSTGHSVRNVIDIARTVTGHPIPETVADRRAGDPAILIADSEKIRRELGWKPRYEI
jgi:UDP-glucose 4-epimerase